MENVMKVDFRKRSANGTAFAQEQKWSDIENEYLFLRQQVEAEKKAYEKKIKPLQKRMKELEEKLRENAKKEGVKRLTYVEFLPKTRRSIDPERFAEFFIENEESGSIYDYMEVPLTKAISAFGEKTLAQSGVIKTTVDEYGRLVLLA